MVVSAQADASLALACIREGAMGYLHKSVDSAGFFAALTRTMSGTICLPEGMPPAARGQPDVLARARALTPRQKDVLAHLLKGLSNKAIARELQVAESTIKTHITEVMRAMDAGSRTQVVVAMAGIPPADWLG